MSTKVNGISKNYRNSMMCSDYPIAALTHSFPQRSRSYTCKTGLPIPKQILIQRKHWQKDLKSTSDEVMKLMNCGKLLRFFGASNFHYLPIKLKDLLHQSQDKRSRVLCSMFSSDNHFYFDGKRVCNQFLAKGFKFSKDIQESVYFAVKRELKPPSTAHDRDWPVFSSVPS